jgi:hypothetical protein
MSTFFRLFYRQTAHKLFSCLLTFRKHKVSLFYIRVGPKPFDRQPYGKSSNFSSQNHFLKWNFRHQRHCFFEKHLCS